MAPNLKVKSNVQNFAKLFDSGWVVSDPHPCFYCLRVCNQKHEINAAQDRESVVYQVRHAWNWSENHRCVEKHGHPRGLRSTSMIVSECVFVSLDIECPKNMKATTL